MPNPKSGTFDLGDGASPLVSSRCAAWRNEASPASRLGNAICAKVRAGLSTDAIAFEAGGSSNVSRLSPDPVRERLAPFGDSVAQEVRERVDVAGGNVRIGRKI